MKITTTFHRRTARGAWVLRASAVAIGLAAAVGLQFAGDPPTVVATVHPSCAADANVSFAVL